jgi:hypothetical protein
MEQLMGVPVKHFTFRNTWFGLWISALFLAAAVPANAQIYVSPQGNDANSAAQAHPIRTLQHAIELARQRHESKIALAGGVYRLETPVVLSPEDSGLVITAAPNASPVLSGAVRVGGWKLYDAKKNLWVAAAPAALKNSRQFYVDGVRASRTRGRVPVALTETDSGYVASDNTMASWRNPSDLEFVYTGGNSIWNEPSEGLGSWTEPRCDVASISGTAITMQQPCWDNSTKRAMLPSGARTANLVGPKSVGAQPEYVENAYELLGTPGEWYFDRNAREIYYVPRPGEDMRTADVEVPVLGSLVLGAETAAAPIHDVTFDGVEFAYATWLGPSTSDGFSEIQANYQVTGSDGYAKQGLCDLVPNGACPYGAWTKIPGSVSMPFSHHTQFLRDAFVHLGAAGLDLGDGAQKDVVEGCVFTDISGNGLQLGGVDQPLPPDAEITSDDRIENNLFRNIGAEYRGGIAIVVGYAQRALIAHNQIDHVPYAGISIGWGGWPDKIQKPGIANDSTDNMISDNRISDFMLVLSDGGGIYTQGRTGADLASGEKVTGNVIHDQWSSGHGIYTDNGSAMITIRSNTIFHTDHDNWNSRHRDYYDGQTGQNFDPLAIEDNWWQQGDADSDQKQVVVKGNHLIASLSAAPTALVGSAGLEPAFRGLLSKRFSAASAPEPPSRVASAPGDGFAYVTWSPSVNEGSAPVTSYTVTSQDGHRSTVSAAEFLSNAYVKVPGLTNGTQYTFTVVAHSAAGTSSPSLPSHVITPSDRKIALPQKPSGVSVLAGPGVVSIHFQDPSVEYGKGEVSPILAYAITVNPGGRTVYFRGRNVIALQDGRHSTFNTIDGLERGKTYTFSVSAVNEAGEGEAATPSPVKIP